MNLVWSDGFDGPAGSLPDPSKWTIVIGGDGYGNGELETYTDRPDPHAMYSTLHRPGYSGENAISAKFPLPGQAVDNGFHVYALDWTPERIRFCSMTS